MTVRQENVVRALEILCAAFFLVLGLGLAAITARHLFHFVSDLLWRLSKGGDYLRWDNINVMLFWISSEILFVAVFLIIARAFWRVRWSRRTICAVVSLALAGFCMFIVSMALLGAAFAQMN